MSWEVERASEQDIPAWLELAQEVGNLFGVDMASDPTFQDWLMRNIVRGNAYCDGAMGFVLSDETPTIADDGTSRIVLGSVDIWRDTKICSFFHSGKIAKRYVQPHQELDVLPLVEIEMSTGPNMAKTIEAMWA